jgi:hypothetical protein
MKYKLDERVRLVLPEWRSFTGCYGTVVGYTEDGQVSIQVDGVKERYHWPESCMETAVLEELAKVIS